jgi:uncharacterized RDD family membrane protein YckC
MAKKKYAKKKKSALSRILLFIAVLLILSIIVPAVFPNATGLLLQIVDFFSSIQSHFISFWMIYSFILVILIAYYNKKR